MAGCWHQNGKPHYFPLYYTETFWHQPGGVNVLAKGKKELPLLILESKRLYGLVFPYWISEIPSIDTDPTYFSLLLQQPKERAGKL